MEEERISVFELRDDLDLPLKALRDWAETELDFWSAYIELDALRVKLHVGDDYVALYTTADPIYLKPAREKIKESFSPKKDI